MKQGPVFSHTRKITVQGHTMRLRVTGSDTHPAFNSLSTAFYQLFDAEQPDHSLGGAVAFSYTYRGDPTHDAWAKAKQIVSVALSLSLGATP